jgi:opacity protein-like surface antigen
MRKFTLVIRAAAALLIVPAALAAQTVQPVRPSSPDRPWSVALGAGLTSASPGSGAALGGAMVLDLSERLSVEVAGNWLDRGRGTDGVTLGGGLIVNLLPHDRSAVPFVALGAAVVRTSFDMDERGFLGGMSGQFGPGATMVPFQGMRQGGMVQGPYSGPGYWSGAWTMGPTVDLSGMPMFYQQRLGSMQMGGNRRWGMRSFTDPALSVGGGVRFNVTDRLYVRPDARALVVIANGDRHTIGTFTVGLGVTF